MHMDVSTASRIVKMVSQAIARLFAAYVKMPQEQDFVREQTKFYAIAKFPRVIGIVDGTHIRIQSPGGENAEVYRNRKSYFSLNVQVVGNADLKFIDVVARWPGSVHDATIFANSGPKGRFEADQFDNCLLIGDSGYPVKKYLMTPLRNPSTRAQQLYNDALVKTRNSIERQIGLWKRRFPVMAYGLRLHMDGIKAAIVATTVLHNIAREMNEPTPPMPDGIDLSELNYLIETENVNTEAMENVNTNWVQNQIVNTHFGG
nr:unnamed protein product [Callosobruchus analis]